MITVTIDGKTIETEATKTIIEAAFEHGIYVPHFCWHPGLRISGNCRMCLVEVEKMPKQVIACSTMCMDGMVVHVNSEKTIALRNAVMEFILINHPLDCPICDEAGECKLQDYTYRFSVGESRFDEEKEHKRKRVGLGPHVMFDAERCISCSRCIRFCEDIVGNPQLTFVQRGDRVTIQTFPGKTLDNPYSMNVIDICPVGALTSRDFRFKARAWDMSTTPSVCPGCARGCNMETSVMKNEILRLTPRENQEVNDFWMCDAGRLESWRHVHSDTRLKQPLMKRHGEKVRVGWDEALAAVASELKVYQKNQVAVIASPYDTCEDNYLLQKLAKDVIHTPYLDVLEHTVKSEQDSFLIREDKTPNSNGARITGCVPENSGYGISGIIAALNTGTVKAVIITDYKVAESKELMQGLQKAQYIVAIVSNTSALTDLADVVLSSATFAEKLGTFLNFKQQLQVIHPSIVTSENERWMGGFTMSRLDTFASPFDKWGQTERNDSRSTWKIVFGIAKLLGCKWKYDHPEDVFLEMAQRIPMFQEISYEKLGRWGMCLDGATPDHLLPYTYSDIHQ